MNKDDVLILFCNCAHSDVIAAEVKKAAREAVALRNARVISVDDLCGLVARKSKALQELNGRNNLIIVACYPRAVTALLQKAGIAPESDCMILNMRKMPAKDIAAAIAGYTKACKAEITRIDESSADWPPWFPVIDAKRCRNCKQCMSFCLFGVYELSKDGKVQVVNPRNCKNHCPACARICPEAAIIFPKVPESPINGAEIDDEDAVKAKIKLNVKEMLGNNVYAALAERRKKAKARLLKPDVEKAMIERAKYGKVHD